MRTSTPTEKIRLSDLRRRVRGPILTPDDATYDEATSVWNGMVRKRPVAVVQPSDARDISRAIEFARRNTLDISVRGGGHNIAGTALVDSGLTIDLSSFGRVEVDPAARIARVGGGSHLADVDAATQQHGLATPLGFYSPVGVGGLTLGGGLGYLTRRFGWTVDNLRSVQIVTPDGLERTASRREEADLFWALRGGGGNFGVVTEFTFDLHEVGPTVFGGLIAWPLDRIDDVISTYRSLTAHAPRELAVWLVLTRAPDAPFVPEAVRGQKVCAYAVCYSGDLGATEDVIAPIRALGDPSFDLLAELPYTGVQQLLDGMEPNGHHYYWKTEFLGALDDGLLSVVSELHESCPIPEALIGLLHIAGAMNERAWEDGAVGNRDARFVIGINGAWPPDEPRGDEFVAWVRHAWERVRPYSTGATYVNFQTADEGDDRVRSAYGPNYARLARLKARYDPDNLFRSNRNVIPHP